MNLGVKAMLLAGLPLLIMSAIGFALLAQGKSADGRATLAVGVIIAATAGASVIYQVGRWSLTRQTLMHFAIMLVTVLPALLFSGWFPLHDAWGYGFVVSVFLATGIVLWTIFYAVARLAQRKAGVPEAEGES